MRIHTYHKKEGGDQVRGAGETGAEEDSEAVGEDRGVDIEAVVVDKAETEGSVGGMSACILGLAAGLPGQGLQTTSSSS